MKSKLFKTTLLLSTCALITLPCLITTSCSENSRIYYQDDLLELETYKIYLNRDTDYANGDWAGLFFNVDPLVVNTNEPFTWETSIKIKNVHELDEDYHDLNTTVMANGERDTIWEFIISDEEKEYFQLECRSGNPSDHRDSRNIYISNEVKISNNDDAVRSKWKSWHWKDPFLHFELRHYPWSKEDYPEYYYYQNISLEIINNTGGWI